MPRAIVPIIALALVAAACGDDGPAVSTPAYEAFRQQPTACGGERPSPAREMQFDSPDEMGLSDNVRVRLLTSCGAVTLELVPEIAPATVNSFVFLAEHGYFDGTVIHRVLPGFVIQAGDPTATGAGGPGYRLPDELPPAGFPYGPGIVAMANAGPHTSGSQFFLVIGETGLSSDFSVFGGIVDGAEALMRIASVPLGVSATGEMSRPSETVYIVSVTVER